MPTYQVGSFIYMLRPLESSIISYFYFFDFFVCNETLGRFSLLLIGILLLRPMNELQPQVHIRTTMSQ